MLIPSVVFLVVGERGDDAMQSNRSWLEHNQRMINVVVMGIFGMFLLFLGISDVF
jgi:hypothetical protein